MAGRRLLDLCRKKVKHFANFTIFCCAHSTATTVGGSVLASFKYVVCCEPQRKWRLYRRIRVIA